MNQMKLIAIILAVIGLLWFLAVGGFLYSGVASGELTNAGFMMGFIIFAGVPSVLGWGVAAYLHFRGVHEEKSERDARLQTVIAEAVQTRGEVDLDRLAWELSVSKKQVDRAVHELVGRDLFTGYVNWDERRLISVEASELPSDRCPNCGGEIKLAGRGVARCEHCGTETYLPVHAQSDES